MKVTSRLLQVSLLAFTLLVAGCHSQAQQEQKSNVVPVQVFEVQPASITRTLEYDADVRGEDEVKVFSQVPERIISLLVEPGDQVSKGQVLAVVRGDTLAQGVQSARAAIEAARADRDNLAEELKRNRKLLARRIVSQSSVDQLQARLRSAEAQIQRLDAMERQAVTARGNAVIRAPIAGIVGDRLLEQGDLAQPTVPLCTVVRLERVELIVEAPEHDLSQIKEGLPARVRVARFPGQTFSGRVERVYPTIDRLTRAAQVKVVLDNRDHRLMPGMLARVLLEVERRDQVAVVPYAGLIIEMGASGSVTHRAFVLDSRTGRHLARERVLQLGIIDGNRVEVREGLTFGERLVTRGQHLLEPGREARITEQLAPDGLTVQPLATRAGERPAEAPSAP